MRIYPQLILWTYLLLPTICLLLSPAIILGIAKAQQQTAKLMVNAINARAKTATALAKNQAKIQHRRLMPNSIRFSNGMSQSRPFNRRTTRDVKMPIMDNNFRPEMFERKTHWDQQEESMGQLQNMWNMNNFGNEQKSEVLRHTENGEDFFQEKSADPEPHHHKRKKHSKNGGYHFRSNENEGGMELQSDDDASFFDQRLANADPHGKKKWGHKNKGHHHFRSSENNEEMDGFIPRPQESMLGNPRIYSENHDDNLNPGAFFLRNVYDAVLSQGSPDNHGPNPSEIMPPSEILGDPQPTKKKKKKLYKEMEPNFYYYPQNYYRPYYGDSPYARDDDGEPQFEAREALEFESEMNDEMMPFERFANPEPTSKKKKKFGKKMQPNYYYYPPQNYYYSSYYPGYYRNNPNEEMTRATFRANAPNEQMLSINDPNLMAMHMPTQPTEPHMPNMEKQRSAAHIGHDHPEDVGCELDDDLFSKKLDGEGQYKNYNPYSYYQRTVEEVSDLSKKIAAASKSIIPPMPHPSTTINPNKQHDEQPQVQYVNSDENVNSKESSDNDDNSVGAVKQESKKSFEEKSANPHPKPHHHSGGFTHTHTHYHSHQNTYGKHGGFHSTPIVYGSPHPAPVYPQPHAFSSSNAEAHAKAQAFSHGNVQNSFSHADAKSLTHGFVPTSTGFGGTETQAAALANTGTGFGLTTAQAAAQANAHNLNGGGFGQSAAQTGFSHADAKSLTHGFVPTSTGFGGTETQAAALANTGTGFGLTTAQAAAQANAHNLNGGGFGQSAAQAGSQSFSGGFGQSASQASAQATSGSNAGPQFFQVLGPSNFINSRSAKESNSQPRDKGEFVMPHLEDIPVRDVLHGMEAELDRFPRSKDSSHQIFDGLNLASSIVDSSLSGNPLIQQNSRQISEKGSPDVERTMGFVRNVLDSSLKNDERTLNDNSMGLEAINKAKSIDSLESTKDLTFQEISSITDLVNKGLRQKRQIDSIVTRNRPNDVLPTSNEVEVKPVLQPKTTDIENNKDEDKPMKDDEKILEMINPEEVFTTEHITIEPWASNWDYVNNREKFPHEMEPQNQTKLVETNEKLNKTNDDTQNQNNNDTTIERIEIDSKHKNEAPLSPSLDQTHTELHELVKNNSNIEVQLDQNPSTANINNNAPEVFEHDKEISESSKATLKNESASNEDSSEENGNRNATTEAILPHTSTPSASNNTDIPSLTFDEIEEIQFAIPDDNETQSDGKVKLQEGSFLDNEKHDIIQAENIEKNKLPEKTGDDKMESSHPNISSPIIKNSSFLFNASESPFSSIEAEMSVLTEQEKDAFIKQEIDLISEVIEETLKNSHFKAKKMNEEHKSENNSKGLQNETSKGEVLSTPNLFSAFSRAREIPERIERSALPEDQAFDAILGAHREKLDNIQKEATDDGDLLMISFIGESVIKDLENRRKQAEQDDSTQGDSNSTTKKSKREIKGFNPDHVPITRLISDPTTKIDVPKTLENVGAVVRNTLENSRAPMYHVRSMIGNTKNTLMSAAKIPPNNIFIPSKYAITKLNGNKDDTQKLGAINQKMLASRSGTDNVAKVENSAVTEPLDVMDTFQQLGGMVKESVNTGKDMMIHVNDAATDARNALYTVRHAAPRLIVPGQIPVVSSRASFPGDNNALGKKAILLTPRLLDVQENTVGIEEQQPDEFVGMGHILDAVGFTQPNQKEVELVKIVLEPTAIDVMKQWDMPKELRSSSAVKTWMKDNLKPDKSKPNNVLGSQQGNAEETLKTLREAEKSVGTNNLKDFFSKMRQEMKEILTSQHEERKRKRKEKARKSKVRPNYTNFKKDYKRAKKKPIRKTVVPIEEPIQKPDKVLKATNTKFDFDKIIDEHSTATLPPEILNIFTNNPSTKHENVIPSTTARSLSDKDDKVGLYLTPELMKPFMGQLSDNEMDNFMRENGDELSSEKKSANTTKIYPITPLNLNITIPMDGHIAPLNLSYLLPNLSPLVGKQIQKNAIEEGSQQKGLAADVTTQDQSMIKRTNYEVTQNSFSEPHHKEDLGHVLGAINPLMFERYYNESLRVNQSEPNKNNPEANNMVGSTIIAMVSGKASDKSLPHPEENDKELATQNENDNAEGRTSMKVIDQYKKPFMGYMGHDRIHEYLNQYNNNLPENGDELDDFTSERENINPVNNVVFSEDDDYNLVM